MAAKAKQSIELDGHVIELSSQDRIVFPEAGITKGDIVGYYKDVASVMVPELRGRALSMERFTKGIEAGGFFQKHWQKHYPTWIDSVSFGGKTVVKYPICDSQAALVYFANQGAIAMHVITSRKQALHRPDLVVFDLDPPDDGFELVRKTARILHDLLDELGLPAFVKTTGSKGLHVIAPLDDKATFEQVHALCHGLAALLSTRHGDIITTEFYKKDRKGRLYFDTARNALGATFVAAYSLRGKPGAPVSMPIEWSEVGDKKLRPDGFTLTNVRERLAKKGDAWRDLRKHPGSITKALAALAKL
ncbi:MAG TPA: non-homologous end-joining DNA ligase [Kofleriaceae bacterium]